MNLPVRISTGYRYRTIPNPAMLANTNSDFGSFKNCREVYQGPASAYNFRKQEANKVKLAQVLAQSGIHFTQASGLLYDGNHGYNQRFVVLTDHPGVLWYKYVGFAAQSGQNHIFINRRRIKVSYFLAMKDEEQAALLSGDDNRISHHFSGKRLALLDEAASLWN